jgi:hypothetical protein
VIAHVQPCINAQPIVAHQVRVEAHVTQRVVHTVAAATAETAQVRVEAPVTASVVQIEADQVKTTDSVVMFQSIFPSASITLTSQTYNCPHPQILTSLLNIFDIVLCLINNLCFFKQGEGYYPLSIYRLAKCRRFNLYIHKLFCAIGKNFYPV